MRVFRHYVSPLKVAVVSFDALIVLLVSLAAVSARYYLAGLDATPRLAWLLPSLLATGTVIPALVAFGGYEHESLRDMRAFTIRLVLAVSVAFVCMAAFLYFSKAVPIWPSSLAMAGGGILLALFLMRLLVLQLIGKKALSRAMIVYGAGAQTQKILAHLDESEGAGVDLRAIIPVGTDDVAGAGPDLKPLLTNLTVVDAVQHFNAEVLLLAVDHDLPYKDLIKIRLQGVDIINLSLFYERVSKRVSLDHLEPDWFLYGEGFKGTDLLDRWAKRLLDVGISLLFIGLFGWLMLVIALAVRLTSDGPAIYRQQRVGLGGQLFWVMKFRSMVQDAEQQTGPVFAAENDPRITKLGHFLRQSRLDELPQLFNILLGEMSFVGPRPERPEFVQTLAHDMPFYNERHAVKPGLTGWAQIQYTYAATIDETRQKLEYDLYYIKNTSLFLDLMIILQTVRVVFFPKGVR